MSTLQVFGSGGDFTIDADTGIPTGPLPEAYVHIAKFDVAEYKEWVKQNNIKDAEVVDILVLGYWHKDGYAPAETDYRQIVSEGWPPPIVGDDHLAKLFGVPDASK